jgi:hypothetical protein
MGQKCQKLSIFLGVKRLLLNHVGFDQKFVMIWNPKEKRHLCIEMPFQF